MKRAALLVAFAVLSWCTYPANAATKLIAGDYTYYPLRLESKFPVVTWEDAGVRVFVARQGAVIRQGPVRLAAPAMVVWFDEARSAQPDVGAAIVKVYAEGLEGVPKQEPLLVHLAEGRKVRQCGALTMHFRSTVGFSWDAPLTRSDKPVSSVFFGRAELTTRGLEEDAVWEAVPPAGPKEKREAVVQGLLAEQVEVFWTEEPITAVYIGDVHGTYENMDFRADAAVLWYDTKRDDYEIYGRGNVRLMRRADAPVTVTPASQRPALTDTLQFLSADELFINPKLGRGLATNAEVRMQDPRAQAGTVYVFRGDQAYLVDSKTMTMSEGSITTCDFARPDYQFKAQKMELMREAPSTILAARDVRFQVGEAERTLISLPFMATDLTRRAYLLTEYTAGLSKKFGLFAQTTWQPLDLTTAPPWVKTWTVNLDYYGARGPAIGTEFEYEFGKGTYPRHRGKVTAFFIRDSATTDSTGAPVTTTNRGRFHLEHRSELSADWRVDAEYYWLSDADFLREFFRADFQQDKTPETYLLARYLHDSTYLALLYKWQVNKFITDLQEKPSLDLEIVGKPLGRLVYDGSVVAGLYDLQFSDQLVPIPPDPPSLLRLHTDHVLSLPFNLGIFRFDPFVRALATWASKSAEPGGTFDGSVSRAGFGGGLTASTTFSRVYDVVSKTFDLNRLRHVVTPYASVETLSVSESSARFIQMDERDAIDSGTEVRVGLRQRLQTKRFKDGAWRPIDWAKLDVALVARTSDSVDQKLHGDYIFANFNVELTDHVSLHSRDDRIGISDQPTLLNVGATVDYLPQWAVGVDFDSISNGSSALTMELIYKLSDRYQLLFYDQYPVRSRTTTTTAKPNSDTVAVLRRFLHDWVLDVGLRVDKATGGFGIIFGFGPRGWGVFQNPHSAARGPFQEPAWAGQGLFKAPTYIPED